MSVSRTQRLSSHRQPFAQTSKLALLHGRVSGALRFFNPTSAYFQLVVEDHKRSTAHDIAVDEKGRPQAQSGEDVLFRWRARDNRKGRHAIVVHHDALHDDGRVRHMTPESSRTPRQVAKGISRLFTRFPYWDISYLVAIIFTLGSVVWVFNAFFVWLPLVRPDTEFPGEVKVAGGVTAFIGATTFEVGSVLLILEAINANRSGCFGWAVRRAIEQLPGGPLHISPDRDRCSHHHRRHAGLKVNSESDDPKPLEERQRWVWAPTLADLREHHLRELGFLASLSQLFGATIFWISGFTALPGVIDLGNHSLANGVFWTPQVVGGIGFIISGILFMLETQKKWYRPAWGILGWHVGLWNLIGAIGFTLCGALGYSTNSGAEYQASLSTFWGSWAFLIASVLQWYGSLSKYVVEVKKIKRT